MLVNSSERAIERAITSASALCGERLLILRTQRPIRRSADVIALDEQGRLLIIEIKNEKSTRRAVGQVLEYLWLYRDASIDDLEDDFTEGNPKANIALGHAYRERFGKELSWNRQLRFVLIATAFDVNTTFGVRYLREIGKVCDLVQVDEPKPGRFKFARYELPDLVHASRMRQGTFGVGRRRLYCVLEAGSQPVLWNLGKFVGGTAVRIVGRMDRLLRMKNRALIPVAQPACVSLHESGGIWFRPVKPRWCVLIGRMNATRTADRDFRQYCLCAVFDAEGVFLRYRAYVEGDFLSAWTRQLNLPTPSWRDVAGGKSLSAVHP